MVCGYNCNLVTLRRSVLTEGPAGHHQGHWKLLLLLLFRAGFSHAMWHVFFYL
jgi:hypothetical protein